MASIRAADEHIIQASMVSNGSDKLVILSHGIATNKDEDGIYTRFAEEFLAPDFDSVRFDFRGHGESPMPSRDATIAGEILDFMAVVRWAREQSYKKLFHVGTSFGASITLLCLARFAFDDFASIVFWNPVINYQNTFIKPTVEWARAFFNHKTAEELAYREGTPIPDTDFVIGSRMTMELLHFRPEVTVWPTKLPLLVIHGDKDTSVPCADAIDYCDRNQAATLNMIPGVDHGFDEQIITVYELTRNWFRDHQ